MARSRHRQSRKAVPSSEGGRSLLPILVVYVALVAAVVAVFLQLAGSDFVDLDDLSYVVNNAHVNAGLTWQGIAWAFTGAYEGYWAPLTWLSYMIDAQLFGLSSAAFHATNVVVHAASACLLFAVMKRATGALWQSAVVAMVFAVHPLHVESVAWIGERKDVLSAFFYLLAIWAYLRYVERPAAGRYLLVMGAFACGLMSKGMVVTLPVVLLLLDAWPLGRLAAASGSDEGAARPLGRTMLALLREKVPLFAMAIAGAAVTIAAQQSAGALATLDIATPWLRVANALVSAVVYLRQMVWPSGLAALYPYPHAVPAWQALSAAALLAGVTIAAVRLRRVAPWFAVGWFWYLATLAPVLGFLQAGPQARADRYTYLAMTGIAVIVVWAVPPLLARLPARRVALATLACLCLGAFARVAWYQAGFWQNSETLFRRALAVTTNNEIAHKGLGTALLRTGQVEGAITELRSALAIAPDYGEARADLGMALVVAGRADEAVTHLTRAVQLQPRNSEFRMNLGSAFYALGRLDEAEAAYREAIRLAPGNFAAQSGLGLALEQKGDLDAARAAFEAALRLNPEYADAQLNLARVLAQSGSQVEAERLYAKLIRTLPTSLEAHVAFGSLLARERRMQEASEQLGIAVRLRPDDAILRSNFGITLVSMGKTEEGIAELTEAVRLRPDLPELKANLDLALSMRK